MLVNHWRKFNHSQLARGRPATASSRVRFHNQFPQFEWVGHQAQGTRAGSGSRAGETNTDDDRDAKRVRFTEGRGQKRQGEDVEQLVAKADE